MSKRVNLFIMAVAASTTLLSGCAKRATPGVAPAGDVDPTTGVVRPKDGGIPFYPGDISLRSVPSMPRAPKRDPNTQMALWHEELIGRPGAHLFVRNDAGIPIRITKVSVYECVNIEGGCVDYDPNLVLQPGEKRRLYSIVPQSKTKMYRFQWRASGGPERTAGAIGSMPRVSMTPPSGNSAPVGTSPGSRSPGSTSPGSTSPSGNAVGATVKLPPTENTLDTLFISDAKGNPLDTRGATLTLTATAPGSRSVKSPLPATIFRTRQMRLTGDVDARGVVGKGVTLFIQVDGPSGVLRAESSTATRVAGTRKATLSVAISIPADAKTVTLGATLDGVGDVTVNQFKFREVSTTPVPRK